MIDIEKAKKSFKEYIEPFKKTDEAGYELKEEHTYNVMKRSKKIAMLLRIKRRRCKTCRANRFAS